VKALTTNLTLGENLLEILLSVDELDFFFFFFQNDWMEFVCERPKVIFSNDVFVDIFLWFIFGMWWIGRNLCE
jgi:hypothetical protein